MVTYLDALADNLLGLPSGPHSGSTEGAAALLEEAVHLVRHAMQFWAALVFMVTECHAAV